MLQLSSLSEAIAAVDRGRDIAVSAYTLGEPLMRAIESRAQAGAHVTVTLEADPAARNAKQLRRRNAHVAAALRACGVDARLERNVHAKTVAVDGTVFFDETNWRSGDIVLRDDASDAARVASRKTAALENEAAMLQSARSARESGAIVETETFDRFNVVSKALRELAGDGLSPRLLVDGDALRGNARMAASLAKIAAQGVDVRVCSDSAKFAISGTHAWLGSANATAAWLPGRDMTDWGVVTNDPAIVEAVRCRVEERWERAREFRPSSVV